MKCLLAEELLREILNSLELLSWVLATTCKDITHATRVFSDSLRYTVNGAKLWRNVAVLAVDLDNEERLLHVSHLHVISLHEVLCNTHLLAVKSLKAHVDRILVEVDVLNEVGLLMAIGTNHSLELELMLDATLLVTDLWSFQDFMDPL